MADDDLITVRRQDLLDALAVITLQHQVAVAGGDAANGTGTNPAGAGAGRGGGGGATSSTPSCGGGGGGGAGTAGGTAQTGATAFYGGGGGGGAYYPGSLEEDLDRLATAAKAPAAVTHEEMVPGRWWVVIAPDGKHWCETSVEEEARESMRPGDRLWRQFVCRAEEFRPVEEAATDGTP